MNKSFILIFVTLAIILSGCIQTQPTGQVVLEPEETIEPEPEPEPELEFEKLEIIEPLNLPKLESIKPVGYGYNPPVEPTPPIYTNDECEYTWDPSVSDKQYRECYNDTYILKINPNSSLDSCEEIADNFFLSKCYKELAWAKKDTSICENGKNYFITFAGAVKNYEVSVSDNCYYELELSYGPYFEDKERDQLCENVEQFDLKKICKKNIVIGKLG